MAVYRKKVRADTGECVLGETWWIDYQYQGIRYRQKIGPRRRDAEEPCPRSR